MRPITRLQAVTARRQRLAGQGADDHLQYQLFREVERPAVVGAIVGERRQLVVVVPGARQVVAGRLGRRIWAVGLTGVSFSEHGVARTKAVVDRAGVEVVEAEGGFCRSFSAAQVCARSFQQIERTCHVRAHESA